MDDGLLDLLAQLRHDNLARSTAYPGGAAAVAWHRAMLGSGLAQGALELSTEGTSLLAFAALWTEPHLYTEEHLPQLVVHRQDTPEALDGAIAAVDRLLGSLRGEVRSMVPLWDQPLRARLLERGFGLASVNLAGRLPDAIAGLGEVPPLPEGVEVEPLRPGDIDGVLCLHAAVFGEEPLYAPFAAHPGFLEKYRRILYADDSPHQRWVVRERGALVGYVSARFNPEDPHHGRSAGVDLVLDRKARGRGLARPLYRCVLDAMAERQIGWIKGTSARPQVLRLAGVMGRRITSVNLSRRDVFPEGWFDPWLEQLA